MHSRMLNFKKIPNIWTVLYLMPFEKKVLGSNDMACPIGNFVTKNQEIRNLTCRLLKSTIGTFNNSVFKDWSFKKT